MLGHVSRPGRAICQRESWQATNLYDYIGRAHGCQDGERAIVRRTPEKECHVSKRQFFVSILSTFHGTRTLDPLIAPQASAVMKDLLRKSYTLKH